MKIRFKIQLLLILAIACLIIAGCSNENTSSKKSKEDEIIELEFWTINLRKNFEDYIQGMIDTYEASHENIKIKWVDVPGADIDSKFFAALNSRDIPDVVNLTSTGVSKVRSLNALYPISDIVEEADLDQYIDGLVEGLTYDGQVMAIPWYHSGPPIAVINKEVYEQAGLDSTKLPAKWDEFLENGAAIHKKFSNIYGSNDIPRLEIFASTGLPILNEEGTKAVFNSDEHIKIVEMFVEGYQNGAVAPGAIVKSKDQWTETFIKGTLGQSGQMGAFELVNIEKNAPTVLPKLQVLPSITGDANKIGIEAIQTFAIPRKSEHPEEAAEFALFITNPDNQLAFTKLVPIFPSTKETLEDPFFTDIEVKTIHDEARKIMVDTAPNLVINTYAIENEHALQEFYLEEIRAALLGEKTAKEALDTAVAHWNEALAKE